MFEIGVQRVAEPWASRPAKTSFGRSIFRPSRGPRSRALADVPALAGLDREETRAYLAGVIERQYERYRASAPVELTAASYVPSTFDPWTMITSSFAHADWSHVIFNVLFFVAFAATVEICLGWARWHRGRSRIVLVHRVLYC
jgi:hypothetical protein